MKKIAGIILIGLLVIALLVGAGGAYLFKSYIPNTVAEKSFPTTDGEIKVEGLDGKVDVYRDQMGIPHIYASTTARPVLRPGIHPRPGPLLADGFLAPHRFGTALRNVRERAGGDG